jgi:hypothetical protein
MKKIAAIIVGVWFVFTGTQELITGDAIGFGTLAGIGNSITSSENPIEFSLMIVFDFFIGLWLIKIGLSKKDIDE